MSRCQPFAPLSVGDHVPDLLITNVHNYKTPSLQLSSLKGQAVIIDFWASWCGSCIETFPELEKLQKEFKGRLKIIMVNNYYPDGAQKIKAFLDKREKRTQLPFTLTYALHDTALRQLFPYKALPHDVWLDATGKVVAITSPDELTNKNIKAFLKNEPLQLPVKDDSRFFDPGYPLLEGKNGSSSFLYRSVITGFKDGLGCEIGQQADSSGKISRVYVINYPLLALLGKAYADVFRIPITRMVIKTDSVTNSLILDPKAPRFCYELITKPSSSQQIQTYMQQDLYRWFGVTAKNDEENINCFVLKKDRNHTIKISKPGKPELDAEPETAHKIFTNQPVTSLITLLERITNKTIVDETGFHAKLDLSVPRNIYDFSIDQLNQFLEENGFKLVSAVRKMKAIVISQE